MSATVQAVRERPILFTGSMVRAIFDGRKSQTRRVVTDRNYRGNVKPSRCDLSSAWVDPGPSPAGNPGPYLKANVVLPENEGIVERIYPPWFAGDRLWVRESHYVWSAGYRDGTGRDIRYRATDPDSPNTWTPSIHMPRWASRLTLEITAVRVERVQDISEADAIAEGCFDEKEHDGSLPSEVYRALWDSLNAKRGYGWDANPWVWVIEFRALPSWRDAE